MKTTTAFATITHEELVTVTGGSAVGDAWNQAKSTATDAWNGAKDVANATFKGIYNHGYRTGSTCGEV